MKEEPDIMNLTGNCNAETQTQNQLQVRLSPKVQEAIDIAMGRTQAGIAAGTRLSARKDISALGKIREWWYRMVWRNGQWSYLTTGRVPQETYYASDRHYDASDPVFRGDLLIIHDHGRNVDLRTPAQLVVDNDFRNDIDITIQKTHQGELEFELPNGEVLCLPNPRRK